MTSPYRIALIVLYFGPLPPYFPVWLKSAEANSDVDFLVWSDQDIRTDAPNFRVRKCSLTDLQERFSKTLNRPLQIPNGYKLCDYRPAFGLLFEEELRGYDFWGHCDIDLVFGRIRHFLTDEILGAYDRFYAYGHLSVYRNNEKMRRAFALPGSWFTLDEAFGPIHIGFDEFAGINRICVKNGIAWHTAKKFASLNLIGIVRLNHLLVSSAYTLYWLDGRAVLRYLDGDVVLNREVCYIHTIKDLIAPECVPLPGEALIVTRDKLLVSTPDNMTPENMLRWNPPVSRTQRILYEVKRRVPYYLPFFTGSFAYKKIWLKQKAFRILEERIKKTALSVSGQPRRGLRFPAKWGKIKNAL